MFSLASFIVGVLMGGIFMVLMFCWCIYDEEPDDYADRVYERYEGWE